MTALSADRGARVVPSPVVAPPVVPAPVVASALVPSDELLPVPDPDGLTPEEYKDVFRQHAAGVAVVTLSGPRGPVGFTATSVISVSAAPPLLAFSVDSGSSSWPALSVARTVVVNFLAEDQADVSSRFATRGQDRFAGGGWSRLPSGEPVLHGTQSWVRARVLDRVPVGTSFLVSLHALEHGTRPEARPLVYRDRAYHRLVPGTPAA